MSGGGAIEVGLHLSGVEDARRAAEELHRVHAAAVQLQNLSASPFVPIQGPLSGLAQGRAESEDHLRIVTDMWKAQAGLNTEFETYYKNVLNVGNAYGYQRDQMIAVRREFEQIQSLSAQAYAQQGALGFARGYGMDPGQVAGGLGAFSSMGALNAGNQQPFLEMLSSAVARGSQGGMNIMMDRFLPILQSLSQQQLMSTPTGVNVGGIAQTLTRFNASGIPGFRDEGGLRVYQGLNQSIQGATGGLSAALLYDQMSQGKQGYDYAQYLQDIAGGASNPETQKQLLTSIYRMSPPGNSQQAQNWRAVYAQAVMPNMDVATLKAMFTTYFDEQGNYIPDQDLGGLSAKYGGKTPDPTALPLLAKLDSAKSAQDLQGVLGTYRDLSGKPLNYQMTGNFDQDKQAIGSLIAGQTTPLMQTDADKMSKAQADQAKAFEDGARELYNFNQALRELNVRIALLTASMAGSGFGGAALFGGTMIGGAASGLMGGLTSAATLGIGLRSLGYMMPTAAPVLGPAAEGFLPGGLSLFGGGGAAAGGASLLGPLAALAAIAVGGTAAGSWGNANAQNQGGIKFGSDNFLGMLGESLTQGPIGQAKLALGIGRAEVGVARKTGLLEGPDTWAADHLPGYAGLFGRPGTNEKEDKQQKTLEDIYGELVKQTQQDQFNKTYQALVASGVPSANAYDEALLRTYGTTTPQNTSYPTLPGGLAGPVAPALPAGSGGGGAGGSTLPMTGTKALPYGPTSANHGANDQQASRYRSIIEQFALPEQIDPDIVQALIMRESGGNAGAIGAGDGKGNRAMGLMQVLASEWPKGTPDAVMLDPVENIRMGIQVLKGKRNMVFGARPDRSDSQNWDATIAAYYGAISTDGRMEITDAADVNGTPGTQYVADVKNNIGTIKGGGGAGGSGATRSSAAVPQSVLLAGAGATAGEGATKDVYDFMGQVELAVTVNGQQSGDRPVLQFGRSGTSTFARIINNPRGVA